MCFWKAALYSIYILIITYIAACLMWFFRWEERVGLVRVDGVAEQGARGFGPHSLG